MFKQIKECIDVLIDLIINMKTDNFIEGRYFAELTKELIEIVENNEFIGCEWRISIYGKSSSEWHILAKWLIDNKLYSHRIRWMI